jgi:hypothetical protein
MGDRLPPTSTYSVGVCGGTGTSAVSVAPNLPGWGLPSQHEMPEPPTATTCTPVTPAGTGWLAPGLTRSQATSAKRIVSRTSSSELASSSTKQVFSMETRIERQYRTSVPGWVSFSTAWLG